MSYKNKDTQRKYQRDWINARRNKYLGGKSCEYCGSDYHLNIHHVNPEEKTGHSIWSWKLKRLEEELAKCIILCEKCHLKLHHPRTAKCGSLTMYKKYKCRCDDCRKANARYCRERRAKIGAV